MKAENRRNETNAADPILVGSLAIVDAETLARNWWVVLLRGIAGIIFGLLTFFAPGISLAALVLLFGAYAFADGILAIVSAIRTRSDNQHWWVLIIEGILGIAAGILTLIWPGITALALLFLIAAWALLTGGLEIAAAIRLRKVISHEWLLVLAGIASIAFGIILALFPGPGALAVVIWIGAYALVSGAMMIGLAFRLRSWARSESPQRMAHSVA
jgi:uncharacterized membrane protein HdeD (DUF308 family)